MMETWRLFPLVIGHGNSRNIGILLLKMKWRRDWDQVCRKWRLWGRRLAIVAVELRVRVVGNLVGDSDTLGVEEAVTGGAGEGGEPCDSGTMNGAEDGGGHAGSDDLLGVLMQTGRGMEVGVSRMRGQRSDGDGGRGLTLTRDRDHTTWSSIGQGRRTNGWQSWQVDGVRGGLLDFGDGHSTVTQWNHWFFGQSLVKNNNIFFMFSLGFGASSG